MKFTIYTSFYNYLDAADDLCSAVINQTYPNWEWIITDDFSDNKEVSKKLKDLKKRDNRIKIIKTEWKKQYYYNIPIEHSSGDIIVKLDSDDIPSIKLLEIYKYNYEKFPDVISIGCSSIFRKNVHNGDIVGAKYINYGKTSNFFESSKKEIPSIVGDARSYRINKLKNNGIFVSENDFKFQRGEDVHKSWIIEEWGNFMALPRVLYHYTMRDNSNSGGLTVNTLLARETNENQKKFFDEYHNTRNSVVNRNELISIEKYYDYSFNHLKNFYFSGLENEFKKSSIEYWSDSLYIEDIKKINDMYPDHNVDYNKVINNPNYLVIDGVDNIGIINKSLKDRKIKDCKIVITTDNNNLEQFSNKIKSMGYGYWFNVFYYTSFIINV
jgi:glycosyltransferase involved in cell wall biosynthesis